jgi:ParB-like chromosome segregation protein Spo0J
MSVSLSLATKPTRSDVFGVNPYELHVNEANRGRHTPPTNDQIVQRAVSMSDLGQIQPVEARRNPDKSLTLTLGYTRNAAARLIREGFTHNGKTYQNPNFMLQTRIVNCTDDEALRRNIAENTQRNNTSPIDDAHNQNKLADLGMADQEISDFYGYDPANGNGSNRVKQYRKLLTLSPKLQNLIHNGLLGVQPALELLDLPEADRDSAVENATRDTGKVNGAVIKSTVRDKILSDNTKGEEEKGTKPRSIREIRKTLEALKEDEDDATRRLASDLLKWVNGKTTDQQFQNALKRYQDAAA